jgi:protein-tyrosine-phosphatase
VPSVASVQLLAAESPHEPTAGHLTASSKYHLNVWIDYLTRLARRRTARRRLSEAKAGAVLFVCQGNLCRSPFAAAVLKGLLSRSDSVSLESRSAGLLQAGRTPPKEAVRAARAFGVDLAAHRSRSISPELLREATLIMVMTQEQKRVIQQRFGRLAAPILLLGDLDPVAGDRDIIDPWGQALDVFETCYQRIDRCVTEVARAVTSAPFDASAPR